MSFARRRLHSTTFYRQEKAYNGYTLFTPLYSEPNCTWLIDMEGNIVHRWELPYRARLHAELLQNGNLLFAIDDSSVSNEISHLPFSGTELIEMDWEGNIVWNHKEPMMECHDRLRLKNGNTIIIKYIKIPKEIAIKVKGGIPGSEADGVMWGYALQEITPKGELQWEWLPHEHLDPEIDAITPLCPRYLWPGLNSLKELPDGNILTCSFHTSNLYIIEKETGNIKWRWGQGKISFPHDPSFLDNGNILVLDNGRFHTDVFFPPDFSRVIEVNPNVKSNKDSKMKAGSFAGSTDSRIEWEFKEENPVDFYTTYIGGCQRLPNGNTLICEGALGRFFEINPKGELVWEYINPFYGKGPGNFGNTNSVYRCFRFGPDHPSIKGKKFNLNKFYLWNNLYARNVYNLNIKTNDNSGNNIVENSKNNEKNFKEYSKKTSQPSASQFSQKLESKVYSRLKDLGY